MQVHCASLHHMPLLLAGCALLTSRDVCSRARRLELLSWGFPKMPLHRDKICASTPERLPALRPEDATFRLVPSLSFLPTSTVYSARIPAGLLHPAPDHGVRPVSGLSFDPRLTAPASASTPPRRRGSHPSELSPRQQPYRVTATLAFSSFAAHQSRQAGDSRDLKALLRRRVRCVVRRFQRPPPDALLGFAPLQGPPRICRSAMSLRPNGALSRSTWTPTPLLVRLAPSWSASRGSRRDRRAR